MKTKYLIHYGERSGYGAEYRARSFTDMLGFIRALTRDLAQGRSITITIIAQKA